MEALSPHNLISTRRGKAEVVFNVLRGLEFQKDQSNDEFLRKI